MKKLLCVLLGPTAVGKTACALEIARYFDIPVISADSRQIYRNMAIGTAAPDPDEIRGVRHFFIGTKDVTGHYSAGQFEIDAIEVIEELFDTSDIALMTGGSMMYIDAVCNGMDAVPEADPETRAHVAEIYAEEGLDKLRGMLKLLDPDFFAKVDLKNHKRVMHAVEVCLQTGMPYSKIRTGNKKQRGFDILKIGLQLPREELYERINIRTDKMIAAGLEDEARKLYPLRGCNALNTVGYKEWFDFFDGNTASREEVARLIKRNTRHYAKKQMTWFKRDTNIHWFAPGDTDKIIELINTELWTRKQD